MISIVIAAIVLVATLVLVVAIPDYRAIIGVLGVLLAIVIVVASCFAQVPTKSVGVPTNFSKTTGETYGPGVHFIAPWTKVTDVDGRKQGKKWTGDSCISVQIADGGTACAWITYEWRLNIAHADVAFTDYGKDGDIINEVYDRVTSLNTKSAVVETFASYDPQSSLPQLSADMDPDALANAKINVVPDYNKFSEEIKALAQEKIDQAGGLVEITQLKFTKLELPKATQDKINNFNAAVAETRIKLQDRATKAAEASGNKEITESLTPEILQSKCLDLVATAIDKGYTFNGAFTCLGSGAGVLVGNTE